jgi:SAM-dependent methyltransferase
VVSGAYAVVTMLDVLEHLEDDVAALREVARILRPGGIVLITVPAFSFLWSRHDELAHHYRRYRRFELCRRLREAGLEPQFVSYFNFFLFPAIALVRLATKALGIRKEGSDFAATPVLLNGVLGALFGAERFLLRFMPLPFGVSVLAVAKKI